MDQASPASGRDGERAYPTGATPMVSETRHLHSACKSTIAEPAAVHPSPARGGRDSVPTTSLANLHSACKSRLGDGAPARWRGGLPDRHPIDHHRDGSAEVMR